MTTEDRDRIAAEAEAAMLPLVLAAIEAQGEAAARALEDGEDVEAAIERASVVYLATLRATVPQAFAEAASLAYDALAPD